MRFVHISDLHFNQLGDGRTSRRIREELITYLHDQKISASELIITGDFRHARYQGKEHDEIISVINYIKKIAETIGITEVEHIHIVPGNHDRDRTVNTRKMSRIRRNYDPQNGTFEATDLLYLKQQFEYFHLVCNELYGKKNYWNNVGLHTYRFLENTVFIYLNTAIMHNCDKDRGRLIIGNDSFDRQLSDAERKHPECQIIVLAHHSPDCFEEHEKQAVEEILRQHPKAFLYLCGDAHETWLRRVNSCVEVTMGCLRQERGVENTFLYGDTETQEYTIHHWINAWEPYRAASDMMQSFFHHIRSSIVITIDENGYIQNDTNLNNGILQWIATGKNEISIDFKITKIKQLSKRCKQLQQKIDKGIPLNSREENEYVFCMGEVNRLKEWAKLKSIACKCFLKDHFIHSYLLLKRKEDYLAMLSDIIDFDPTKKEYLDAYNNPENELIDFTIRRTNANKEYYFVVPISHDTLLSIGLNPLISFSDICFIGFDRFDKKIQKEILKYFYYDFAREILYNDATIAEDEHAKNLLNYNLGIH